MSAIQDFIDKMWGYFSKICAEYGVTDDALKESMIKTKSYLKKIDFEDQDYVNEVCSAIDTNIEKHSSEKQVSLSDSEVKALKSILDHAYDGTVLTTNKPVTKAELDSLKKNIGSIKKKLK